MPSVFGLSIHTATGNSCTVGNENVLSGIFGGGGGERRGRGGNFNNNFVLQVFTEKIKICFLLLKIIK